MESHFKHFLENQGATAYWTRVYLDYGGNGLVKTRCQLIPRRDGPRSADNPFIGILCADSQAA